VIVVAAADAIVPIPAALRALVGIEVVSLTHLFAAPFKGDAASGRARVAPCLRRRSSAGASD
jgi:hypothetical protein